MAENLKIKNTSVIDTTGLEKSEEEINKVVDGANISFDDNDIVTGKVVKIEHDEVLVDIGFKSEGVIPLKELSIRKDANAEDIVNVGDEIEALVVQKEDNEGRLILSKKRADYEKAWNKAAESYKSGEIVTGEVIEIVRGGLILDIGLRAFLPASLVDIHRVYDLDNYLGTMVEARIIEMDKVRNNVVLSRKVLLEEGFHNEKVAVLEKLAPGMKLKGKVSSIVDFGVFVGLGVIDGLVHISELSWDHVSHPSEVVSVGDEVEVVVLDVDHERERISLGIKQTTEDPWLKLAGEYPMDSIHEVEVTRLVPFGSFVKFENDVEGLIHVSELAPKHIDNPAQVVHIGDKIQAKVVGVNEEKHRISLSMREAAEELGFEIEIEEMLPENVTARKRSKTVDAGDAEEPKEEVKEETKEEKEDDKKDEKADEKKEDKEEVKEEEKEEKKTTKKAAAKKDEKKDEETEDNKDEKEEKKTTKKAAAEKDDKKEEKKEDKK